MKFTRKKEILSTRNICRTLVAVCQKTATFCQTCFLTHNALDSNLSSSHCLTVVSSFTFINSQIIVCPHSTTS